MEIKSNNSMTISLVKEVTISEKEMATYTDPSVPLKYRVHALRYDMLRYRGFDLNPVDAIKLIRKMEE